MDMFIKSDDWKYQMLPSVKLHKSWGVITCRKWVSAYSSYRDSLNNGFVSHSEETQQFLVHIQQFDLQAYRLMRFNVIYTEVKYM